MEEAELAVAMKAYRRAVALAGGQPSFERLTGIKQQTTSYRLNNGIPLQTVSEVEAVETATGVSRYDLRPDMYPREDGPRAPAGEAPPALAGGSPDGALDGVQS